MTTATIISPVLGGIVAVPLDSTDVFITTPTPAENYYAFAQTSEPITCWQSNVGATAFTISLQSPADDALQLNYLLVSKGNPAVSATVVSSGSASIDVDFTDAVSLFAMPTWQTQIWIDSSQSGTTIHFSNPPPVDSFLYIYTVDIAGIQAFTEPVNSDVLNATLPLLSGPTYVPFVMANWNTAIGVSAFASVEDIFCVFSTPVPSGGGSLTYFTQFVEPLPPEAIMPTVPEQQPFVIAPLTQAQMEERFSNLYPFPWTSSLAKTEGVAYAIFWAYASMLSNAMVQLQYAWSAARLQTASDVELDLFSTDYFGTELPRLPGEPDDHYRQRIMALLFQPKVTRQAIINAIKFFTGGIVRAIEPWNPGDTGYYGADPPFIGSYYDYDSEEVPSLYGDGGLRYQGFLQIELPPAQGGTVNIWGFDLGAAYDYITGIEWPTDNQFNLQEATVNALISTLIAFGTTAWVKYVNGFIYPVTQGACIHIATNIFKININLPNLAGLYGFFAQLSLPVPVWVSDVTYEGFDLTFRTPTSSGTYLSYLALEVGNPALNITSTAPGQFSQHLNADCVHNSLFAMASWDTNVFYSNRSSTGITLNYDTPPAFDAELYYLLAPVNPNVGIQAIPAQQIAHTVTLTLDGQHVPFGIANWNTTVGVVPDFEHNQVTFVFSNPAPIDGTGEIMYVNYDVTEPG